MVDWKDLMRRAKDDVIAAVKVWSEVLNDIFGTRLDYVYSKGSALKDWDSIIDYVPTLSDVDIHIMTTDANQLFTSDRKGFLQAMNVSKQYEETFLTERPDYLHITRSQVMQLNRLTK